MKVVAYNIKEFEKEALAKANQKKHDITLISNKLDTNTLSYASGKDAVVLSSVEGLNAAMLHQLAKIGIRYMCVSVNSISNLDLSAANELGIEVSQIPSGSNHVIADAIISNLDDWHAKICFW